MTFKFQGKHCFLTYPRCDAGKQAIYDHLLALSFPVDRLLVAEEKHEDGGQHIHAYLAFKSRPCIRNQHYFDIRGFHPNIQTVRRVRDVINYITKEDGDPLSNFEWKDKKSAKAEAVQSIMAQIEQRKHPDEILVDVINSHPELLLGSTAISHFIQRASKGISMSMPIYELSTFSLSHVDKARIELWSSQVANMERGDRTGARSMWFIGPSRMGKTCLARSIGNHWYMQTNFNLTNICDEEKVYGVLDDIDWDILSKFFKGLLGCQKDVDLHDKFCRKKRFTLGYPVIICTNEPPILSNEQAQWLRKNVDFYKINHSVLPNSPVINFEKYNI